MILRDKTVNRILVTIFVALASIAVGFSIIATVQAQQHKTTTLIVSVNEQVLFVEQYPNVFLEIRLPHGVTAQLWADNTCGSPKNNAMTISTSGTYTIPEQNIKGHGEKFACLLSSDGKINLSISLRAQQLPSATTVTSSLNPASTGQPVTFTATVAASGGATGTPTGSVTFDDGAAVLATVSLNSSGVATFTTGSLAAGAHSITSVYGGDSSFA
jgi:hypothetical protein